jgi:hypothetical protein
MDFAGATDSTYRADTADATDSKVCMDVVDAIDSTCHVDADDAIVPMEYNVAVLDAYFVNSFSFATSYVLFRI